MYSISLSDFRGFHKQSFVPVKPITVLVGENSAGKTSFLAALKFMLDFASGEVEPSFNKDPFQLGTFQQIAHHRGGRAGRAKEFRISLRQPVALRPRARGRQASTEEEIDFEVILSSSESQAAISSMTVSSHEASLRAFFDSETLRLDYISGGQTVPIERSRHFPRVARTDFARYWSFILSDLRYRLFHRGTEKDEASLLPQETEEKAARLAELAAASAQLLSGPIEATSAIRTKPLRTYTPGLEAQDGEGSHVPYEIAKLYRSRSKDSWRRLKDSIESYGSRSDMFKEIDVKSFGSTASDPFQIQFSSDGPKMNIVDLGYGTSQVLPILYWVFSGGKSSKFLIQQPEVHLHPRAQAALGSYFVDAYRSDGKNFVLETHSDFIVDRVRSAVAEGLLSPIDVSILFFERRRLENVIHKIDLDSNGEPVDPPDSYRDFFVGEQLKILGLS